MISAWLLATENELKRGITIAFLSSIIQALVAIILVVFAAPRGERRQHRP